ncbi:hypothetical protein CASFOL_025997 [Castilleja foliolosa]|uniref:Centromere protein C n=1 Tax=Castilleja foliolosa TaxID=1961234 RepID=A0ABD3CSP6_9LAMI
MDPLSGLIGPSLFPRTIKAPADFSVALDPKDLDSIHSFMKSLPAVIMESSVDINSLEDPDEFFDAYEMMEKANKEIQKQLGVSVDDVDLFQPLNKRCRRPGILGKSFTGGRKYKHRYNEDDYTLMMPQVTVNQDIPSSPKDNSLENLVPLMSSEKTVDHDIPSASKVNSQEDLVHQDPNPNADLEEVELEGYMKKTNNEDSDLLEELLSCNYEVLEGDGAMNLLQERLNIKTYDRESLPMTESYRKLGRNSLVIDSVLKNLSKKPTIEHEGGSVQDQFSPVNAELSECPNISVVEPKDQPIGQVDAANDLCTSSEFESRVNVGDTEHVPSNMDALEVMGNEDVLPEQLADENASAQHADANGRPIEERDNDLGRTMKFNDESNPSVLEEETRNDTLNGQLTVPEQQPEAHPMRKSLAEAGTSFKTVVRRSKRIRMRPLEYWKGDRFLYGRVDDSKKLLGVKYISPGKGNGKLKVKPFILSESTNFKEELELATRH